MPDRPLSVLKLSIAIAIGVWLGFIAIALTAWLASDYLFKQALAPVAQAVQQLGKPAVVAPEPPNRMFEQYEKTCTNRSNSRPWIRPATTHATCPTPKCQFWLQQDQNAPNDKSRANVLQFCD